MAGDQGRSETAIWLLPAAAGREALAGAIGRLAARFGAPLFAPHATVFGGVAGPFPEVEGAVARAARATAAFILTPSRLAHSAAFFRCLVLELGAPAPILALRRRLGRELGRRPGDAARPHVSLLYAELPAGERVALWLAGP
jgi:hypothetical protein